MEITLTHQIEYGVDQPVAVEDLVRSIQAHTRLMRSSASLLSELFPGLTIHPRYVSVSLLSQQSPLKEMFAFAVIMSYQDELEESIPALFERLTGVSVPEQHDTVLTVFVMLVAVYGISKAFDLLFPGRPKEALNKSRKSLLKSAASVSGIAASRIATAAEVLVTGSSRRSVVSASQGIFSPTRNHPNAAIKDSRGRVLISSAAVREAQSAAGLPIDKEEDSTPLSEQSFHRNVRIVLHAMDKDRKRRGWAGHCPDLFDDRITMHLEKSVPTEDIFGRGEIVGDIILTKEEDETGAMKPKEFLLLRPSYGS